MKTGFRSLKLVPASFIVPFMLAHNPDMLMIDVASVTVFNRRTAKHPTRRAPG